jgi:hypothetical protein
MQMMQSGTATLYASFSGLKKKFADELKTAPRGGCAAVHPGTLDGVEAFRS